MGKADGRRRRWLLPALAIFLVLGPAQAAAPRKPQHILSLMQCTDMLLLMLVPRERIASVTYLAHDAVKVLMPGADAGVAINHGTAEEILRQKPDLILAGTYSAPTARRMAARTGIPLVEVDTANTFDDIRRTTRQVGKAVGEPERAEQLVARMDATLARLAATRPAHPVRVVAWSGAGDVPGRGTLTDAIITAAGAVNIGTQIPDARYGSFSIEELLASRPDAILQGADRWDPPSLRDARSTHPLIQRLYRGRRITYPVPLYTCGIPQSADAAVALRAALRTLPAGSVRW